VALIGLSGRTFAGGLLIGAGLASFGWVLYHVDAIRNYAPFIGSSAERWTARMLKAAPASWRSVPNVRFEDYDVDYVILTPDALLAVEVKWRPQLSERDEQLRQQSDLDQSWKSARKMRLFLYASGLQHLPVIPVLLLWGPGIPVMPGGRVIEDEIHVLDGNQFDSWKHHYETGHRLLRSIDATDRALHEHITKTERAA
jgi:hypothetical protein